MGAPAQVPTHVGKYRVERTLGEGAMGVVYLAHDPVIDRPVAIKTIRKELLASHGAAALVERFRREAVAAGRLSHGGIVAVYDYGEADGAPFIVMEYAPGESLHDHVARRGALPLAEIGAKMTQLLEALGYAHERGVVHRDVKPSNVIVSSTGQLKITDFGIARIQASDLTRPGAAMGTPAYMAPEQYVGGAVDARADLFAAGVMLYELLTGTLPFDADTLESMAYRVVHAEHDPPSRRRPRLGTGFDPLLARALAKKPEGRPASAAEFAGDIAAVVQAAQRADPAAVGLATTMIGGIGMAAAPGVSAPGATGPAAGLAAPGATGPGASAPWASGFRAETLRELETSLAAILGPLSGVLVRRAASEARSAQELIDVLGRSASSPAEAQRIAEAARRLITTAPDGGPATSARAAPQAPRTVALPAPAGGEGAGVSEADVARTTMHLATYVGPIARVLVKRALPGATDLRALCMLLAAGIEKPADREKFLKAMKVA